MRLKIFELFSDLLTSVVLKYLLNRLIRKDKSQIERQYTHSRYFNQTKFMCMDEDLIIQISDTF